MKHRKENILGIPAAFQERMAGLLGDEYPSFLSSLQQPAITGLRVNTLKISATDFQTKSPWKMRPVSWCPAGFILPDDILDESTPRPGKHPYHSAGLYYLQEPAAMAAAEILAPQPGERVLDLAAAPGGKATHLAGLMRNSGVFVANEIHPKRFRDLIENLERCGITNSMVTQASPQALVDQFGEYFDRVLLDAPCSGEGMFRKGDVARREWKPNLVRSCATRQSGILESASLLVKVGGHLVYSTCTFSPEENEGVIANFLALHPEFELVTINQLTGFSPARPEWVGLPPSDRLARGIRIWPHLTLSEGHFITHLIKNSLSMRNNQPLGNKLRFTTNKNSITELNPSNLILFNEFCRHNLSISFDPHRLVQVGELIYFLPEPTHELSELTLLHPGWMLGNVTNGRFNPSHALAMGIKGDQAYQKLNLTPDDSRLSAYFLGETIANTGENSWILVCTDDFPIGWGKRVNGVIKNYYPHQIRRNL